MNSFQHVGKSNGFSLRGNEMKHCDEALLLVEIEAEAESRFGHRQDKDRLVKSTLDAARELIARRPAVTDFIGEIAIASSRAH